MLTTGSHLPKVGRAFIPQFTGKLVARSKLNRLIAAFVCAQVTRWATYKYTYTQAALLRQGETSTLYTQVHLVRLSALNFQK
jgi:hypothetical protein